MDAFIFEFCQALDRLIVSGRIEGWDVRLDVVPIFGGTEDKRRTGGTGEGTPDLVVTGLVLFGGVTLKD